MIYSLGARSVSRNDATGLLLPTISALTQRYAPPSSEKLSQRRTAVQQTKARRWAAASFLFGSGYVSLAATPARGLWVGLLFVGLSITSFLLLSPSYRSSVLALSEEQEKYYRQMLHWRQDFACLQCGHPFRLRASEGQAVVDLLSQGALPPV